MITPKDSLTTPTRDGYNILWQWWDAQDMKGAIITESHSDWYMLLVVEECTDFSEIALNSHQARDLAKALLDAADHLDQNVEALVNGEW